MLVSTNPQAEVGAFITFGLEIRLEKHFCPPPPSRVKCVSQIARVK